MPLVSVVVPTRNRAALLKRTLRSIVDQHLTDLEILVIDDGSTDDTQVTAGSLDRRVRILRSPEPAGVSAARNRGIAAARGEWIAFCDDDDVWAPDKLTRQLAAAQDAHRDWAYVGDVNVDGCLRVLSGGPPPHPDAVICLLPRWNPLTSGASNVIVRAKALDAVGGFDPTLRRTEDWDLWIRLARIGPPACVAEPLVAYRFHRGNVVTNPRDMVCEARRLATKHHIAVDMAAMHRRAAWSALRAGRRLCAARHYLNAVARGDLRSIGRAAIALTHPAVGTDRLFALLGRDREWIDRATLWLARLAPTQPADQSSWIRLLEAR